MICLDKNGGDSFVQRNNIAKQRNYGIDLLRLLGAFYVIILHTIYQAGIYYCVDSGSVQQKVCQIFLSFSFCAVNIFGLISGYTGYSDSEKGYKFSNYVLLWLQVVAYGCAINLFSRWLFPEAVRSPLLHSLFPVTHDLYWYFTAYTLLFFFTPLLNSAIRGCKRETLIFFLVFLLAIFSPYETLYALFRANMGYSFLWLMVLYLVGAALKKLQLEQKIHIGFLLFGILALTALTYSLYILLPQLQNHYSRLSPSLLMSYTFPLYLYSAVLYILLFAKVKFGRWMQQFISFAAPGAFSIYIVNVHPVIWAWLKDHFCYWARYSISSLVIRILAFAGLFVGAVVIIDYIRRKIFALLHIKQFLERVFSKITVA